MAKCFVFKTPDQLKEAVSLRRDGVGPSQILNTAKVWSAVCRQKGKTTWDGRICVEFSTEGRERKAVIFRYGTNNEKHILGELKYNAALKWCRENLEEMQP